jgi:uncharacterized protein YuzE
MSIRFEIDPFADAVYVQVSDEPVARTLELDAQRTLEYNVHGEVVGMVFLGVRRGVDLSKLPYHDELATYFAAHEIRVNI